MSERRSTVGRPELPALHWLPNKRIHNGRTFKSENRRSETDLFFVSADKFQFVSLRTTIISRFCHSDASNYAQRSISRVYSYDARTTKISSKERRQSVYLRDVDSRSGANYYCHFRRATNKTGKTLVILFFECNETYRE